MTRRSSVSRRRFLQGAAAMTAAPLIVPRTVFGRNAPSERFRVGFIGTGKQSRGHLNWFLNQGDVAGDGRLRRRHHPPRRRQAES